MQLIVINIQIHELEDVQESVHENLYFCAKAKFNERQLRELIGEVTELIVYIRSLKIQFGNSFLCKNLEKRCQNFIIKCNEDLKESERVHLQ